MTNKLHDNLTIIAQRFVKILLTYENVFKPDRMEAFKPLKNIK